MVNATARRATPTTNFDSLVERLQKSVDKRSGKFQSKKEKDERFWKPTIDDSGNGFAIIRFLDAPKNEDMPYVEYADYGFKGPTGKWYIEKSLTSIGKTDPAAELKNKLYRSELKTDKELSSIMKRRINYVSNILVVNDPANPDNNGKVFLFRFGPKILDKILECAKPAFDIDEKFNIFDLYEGCNFRMKVKTNNAGIPNYDSSDFDRKSTPIAKTDEEIEAIHAKCYSLDDLVSPDKFKTYAELKERLDMVMGLSTAVSPVKESTKSKSEDVEDLTPPWDDPNTDPEEDVDDFLKNLQEQLDSVDK